MPRTIKKFEDLERMGGKPILEIPERRTIDFQENSKNRLFLTESDEKKLQSLEKNGITLDETPKGILVKTEDYVGIREFGQFILKVVPKQVGTLESLGRMIAFCYLDKVDIFDLENVRFQKKQKHPLDFLMIAFTQLSQKLIKNGLYRKYEVITNNIPYLKGKLVIKQQIQNTMKFNMKFNCEYDEFTSNNLENQIILHTLKRCLKISPDTELKTRIQKLIHQIDKQVDDKQIRLSDFKKIHYTRLNKNYQTPLVLSKLILENSGMENLNELKDELIVPFFVYMPGLFEKFLQKLLEYTKMKIEPQFETIPWQKDGKEEKKMKPDLVIYENRLRDKDKKPIRENIKFIADAKYMEDIGEHERYQIAFYLNEFGIKNGFAISPTQKPTLPINNDGNIEYQDDESYTLDVPYQEISIHVRHVNVDEFLDLVFSDESIDEKAQVVKKIISYQ